MSKGGDMSLILVVLIGLFLLISGGGVIVFIAAARRTNQDWEQHPATRRLGQELERAEAQSVHEAQQGAHSKAGQA
jgi:hypothetical protein